MFKTNSKPVQSEVYQLKNGNSEYFLFREADEHAVFINDSTAVIWQLCDGSRSVGEIKNLLEESYPENASAISEDVDGELKVLLSHNAIEHAAKS